jgi:hypothetical protein
VSLFASGAGASFAGAACAELPATGLIIIERPTEQFPPGQRPPRASTLPVKTNVNNPNAIANFLIVQSLLTPLRTNDHIPTDL